MYLLSVFLTDLIVSLGPPPDCLSPFAWGWGKAGGWTVRTNARTHRLLHTTCAAFFGVLPIPHTSIVNPPPLPGRGRGGAARCTPCTCSFSAIHDQDVRLLPPSWLPHGYEPHNVTSPTGLMYPSLISD